MMSTYTPSLYDGKFVSGLQKLDLEKDWADWSFVMRSHCGMLLPLAGGLMDQAVMAITAVPMSTDDDEEKVQQDLYHLLVLTTQNTVLRIVKGVAMCNGLEAGRKLHERFEPATRGRKLGLLNSIFGLRLPAEGIGILDGLNRWEQFIKKYESGGDLFSDDVQTAVALQALPSEIRSSVIVPMPPNATCLMMRAKIEELVLTVQQWSSDVSMEIDDVGKGRGKGKDKDKDKGKGKGQDKYDQ